MKKALQNQVKLSQLEMVVAVAATSSFSEAALELGISQSAVSHAISSLEEALGIVIFSRGRHGATLTPVGDRILIHAKQVINGTAAILQEAAIAKGLEQGKVRVATFRSIATHILPDSIKQLYQKFPGIVINLAEHDDDEQVEQALRAGQADIGIVTLPAGKGLTTWELLKDEYVVLLPPETQLLSESLTWEELARHPLMMPPLNYVMMRPVYDYINGLGYWLNVVNEIETDAATVNLVAQGLGGTILPRLSAEPIPAAVQVYPLPTPLERNVGVAIVTDALQTPAVYALLDILRSQSSTKSRGAI
ncbi:MAG: LysR family transcriptional regulator [Leptolyngbya sp. SIOISBB]|nr:LysR family transcriptional regulator [Leptolyngbya sp. SIOISBB]